MYSMPCVCVCLVYLLPDTHASYIAYTKYCSMKYARFIHRLEKLHEESISMSQALLLSSTLCLLLR